VVREQVVRVQRVFGSPPVEGLVRGQDRFPPLDESRQLRPDLGVGDNVTELDSPVTFVRLHL
jgi:hypothetical protein